MVRSSFDFGLWKFGILLIQFVLILIVIPMVTQPKFNVHKSSCTQLNRPLRPLGYYVIVSVFLKTETVLNHTKICTLILSHFFGFTSIFLMYLRSVERVRKI